MQVEHAAEEKITADEVQAAAALWVQQSAPSDREPGCSSLADVAEALGIEKMEAQRLISQVRHRRLEARRSQMQRLAAVVVAVCTFLTTGVGVAVKTGAERHRAAAQARYAAFLASPEHLKQVAEWRADALRAEHERRWRIYRGRYFAHNDTGLTDVDMLRTRGQDSLAYEQAILNARKRFEAGIAAEKSLAAETGTGGAGR